MQSLVLLHLFACGYYLIASFQGTSYVGGVFFLRQMV
ncbi:hypothetical protein OKO_02419 [Enterococcus faecium EnGen0056]|uniref:Uncharacterized protein n=1 Tax=Enterococcus faecium EnGen0003 TaxID=1138901 RepID=A0A828ZPD9_ENTFC|nr:hypothetical protein OIE_05586 [Enterococcus faecium EnGen0003]ELB49423.1 hypothetical protein OKI_05196 [Enterococcus faecium EnGen0038]ELB53872.1 hypothetical protein OKO_02419 [Enterococcus faecium EnGen0056]